MFSLVVNTWQDIFEPGVSLSLYLLSLVSDGVSTSHLQNNKYPTVTNPKNRIIRKNEVAGIIHKINIPAAAQRSANPTTRFIRHTSSFHTQEPNKVRRTFAVYVNSTKENPFWGFSFVTIQQFDLLYSFIYIYVQSISIIPHHPTYPKHLPLL